MGRWWIAVLGLIATWACSAPVELGGTGRVIDGDTLEVAGQVVRLLGVDAPELEQICTDSQQRDYACGQLSSARLAEKLGQARLRCQLEGRDVYGRSLGLCWLGDLPINAWLVEQGLAWASPDQSNFAAQENAARQAQRGVWPGGFVFPWKYRKNPRAPLVKFEGQPRFEPDGPDRDCGDFEPLGDRAWIEAQIFFEAAEAIEKGDRHRLDSNRNGLACDALRTK